MELNKVIKQSYWENTKLGKEGINFEMGEQVVKAKASILFIGVLRISKQS